MSNGLYFDSESFFRKEVVCDVSREQEPCVKGSPG